jgi:two-component system, cell cycle response regulator CtrA
MRILLIEDDAATAAGIALMLKKEGFVCDKTDLGEDGLEIGKLYDYDIIILDLMLPDIDGYEVLRRLRLSKVRTPVLILSGLGGVDDRIKALGYGADDFLTKPFDKRELIARIRAIVRRSKGHDRSAIEIGDLTVDLEQKTVEVDRQRIPLTAKEFGILELMALRKGTVVTKEAFLNHLYGGMDEPEPKIVDVFICKLRKKLQDATGKNYVQTIWGRGYKVADPAEQGQDHAAQ